ncbi:LysE family translocator [Roseicyclus sp.]|uniref:LysE family translocator n=1 Tax=Roseicyclus sp. TaxID=1914329 RepID=UPI003F9F8283
MSETLALLVFLLPLAYSPGPGNMVFAANGARFGLAATLPASAGYHLATWLVTAGIGLGLVGIVAQAPGAARAMQLVGAAYVLWLAVRIASSGAMAGGPEARPLGAGGGALLLLVNPKAYLIIALMFSQFLPGEGSVAAVLWIATVFTLNNLLAFTAWTVAGECLARLFLSGREGRWLNVGFGLTLGAVAVWMLLA